MTPTELRALILASGLSNSEFARRIPIAYRSLTRMLSGDIAISERMATSISRMLGTGEAASSEWPRDEWIVGEGPPAERREYIVHAIAPRFIARVVSMDMLTDQPEPDEEPCDIVSGIVYQAGESMICEIVWIDAAPTDPTALAALMDRAADHLERDIGADN